MSPSSAGAASPESGVHNVGPKFFAGGAAVGSTAYFAPFVYTNVGKLEADAADPTQGTYTDGPEIDYYSGWPGPQQPWIKRTEVGAGGEVGVSAMSMAKTERYGWGAAAVGKYFVFGPYNYSGVGVMDTESGAIEYYPLEISGCWENLS